MTAKKQKLKLGLFPIKTKKDLENIKEREETSFEISSLVSGCGEVTDYRTFMEDFRKCAEFVKWLKEKTEG